MKTTESPSRYATTLPAGKSPYLLLFRDASASAYKGLSSEQRQQLFTQWYAWYDRLAAEGKLLYGHPLEEGGRVVSARNGRVTDGPFTEAKEVVGGYFFLAVADEAEAVAIAKGCPTLKHPEIGLSVEVRPVAGFCPVLSDPAVVEQTKLAQAK
ncbi:MAG: YciI family protein [Nibricoccus sp.]